MNYEAVIGVNSQSGKGCIVYLVKQDLHLDVACETQVAFYEVVHAITTAFRETYHFGGGKYEGRLDLRSFRVMSVPAQDVDGEADDLRQFDGTVVVDGCRLVRRAHVWS